MKISYNFFLYSSRKFLVIILNYYIKSFSMIKNIKFFFIQLLLLNFNGFNIILNKKKGFKTILKHKNLSLLRKIKSEMLDIDFSDEFFSTKNDKDKFKISLIQYLNDNYINSNSNFIQLLFYYFGKKKNLFIFPLPEQWAKVLIKNGIKTNTQICRFLWIGYVLTQYIKGILLFSKLIHSIILKKIKNYFYKSHKKIHDFKNKDFSIFVGDTPKDLGLELVDDTNILEKSKIPSLIQWYKKNNPNEYIIATSIYNDGNKYFEKYAFLKNNYDYLLNDLSIFFLTIRFIKIQIKILFNLFIFKWGYAILHEEIIISQIFKHSKTFPKNIFFYWYANTYKPLWAIELENKKSKISIYLRGSINNLSENRKIFKENEDQNNYDSIGYKIEKWNNYLIWHPALENMLRKKIKSINKISNININPYEPGYHNFNSINKIIIPPKSVSVFPYCTERSHFGISKLNDYLYSDKNLLKFFLDNIYEVLISNNIQMILKVKKKKYEDEYKRDLKIFEKYKNKKNVVLLTRELPIYSIVCSTLGSISVPFSSTALIAEKANKPSIYYDPLENVLKDDSYSCGIKTIFGNKELSSFIGNLK